MHQVQRKVLIRAVCIGNLKTHMNELRCMHWRSVRSVGLPDRPGWGTAQPSDPPPVSLRWAELPPVPGLEVVLTDLPPEEGGTGRQLQGVHLHWHYGRRCPKTGVTEEKQKVLVTKHGHFKKDKIFIPSDFKCSWLTNGIVQISNYMYK